MTLKIGGFDFNSFYNENWLNNSSAKSNGEAAINVADNFGKLRLLPSIEKHVTFTVSDCKNELDLKRAALMAAAAKAGIGSPARQADFADAVLAQRKPNLVNSTRNNKAIEDTDVPGMNGKTYTYELNSQEIAELKLFRENYAHDKQLVFVKKPAINARQPNSAGTVAGVTAPNAPQTLKFRVSLPKTGEPLKDRALLGYIEDKHGHQKTGLWGSNTINVRNAAKSAGVGIKVLQTFPPNSIDPTFADVEISVQDVNKIRGLAISEREKLTQNTDAANNANRNTFAQKFAEGFFKGAWGSLKGNAELVYEAVKDPLGAAWKIGEALVSVPQLATKIGIGVGQAAAELAKMTPAERQNLINELVSKGYTNLRDMPVEVAAEKAGEIVGTIAMEAVLGKGASIGLKGLATLKNTKAGAAFINRIEGLASAAKQTIAETKVPVKITAEVLADAAGGTTPIINVEKKSFGELLNQMMSQAKDTAKSSEKLEMLKNGSTAGKEAITETAEQGLTEVAQSGVKSLKHKFSKEILAEVRQRLVTLNVARTELMSRIDVLVDSNTVTSNTKGVLVTLKNQLKNGTKQDDLIGALRDLNGEVVRRSGDGKSYEHLDEIQRTLNSISNAHDSLIIELSHKNKGSAEFVEISNQLDAIKEMKRLINEFLESK